MAKNIVICADGTGNTAIKGRGTNVFKLYEAVDENGHRMNPTLDPQVAIYDDGVGTESFKWIRIASGATGWGLSRNVKQLYGELARVFDLGDRIFLFGFSRGAFTVRTLAGLIATCGILDCNQYATNRAFTQAIDEAYRAYRRKYQTWVSKWLFGVRAADAKQLRKRFSVSDPNLAPDGKVPIRFLGVWDTVDAVGMPFHAADVINAVFYRFKFPDTTLNDQVEQACQALALDEERQSFQPLLWDQHRPMDKLRIEQVWFAGVHSNVGGGYPRQGMSLVALDWMMMKAEAAGLRFNATERDLYRGHVDVNDKLYDSRAGLGIFYRWSPRNVQQLCADNGVCPKIHRTVFDRIARNTEGYVPGVLPAQFELISTTLPPAAAKNIETLVDSAHQGAPSLIAREGRSLALGQLSYFLLLTAVAGLLLVALWMYGREAVSRAGDWLHVAVNLASGFFGGRWIRMLVKGLYGQPRLFWSIVAALAMAYGLEVIVDEGMNRRYSRFWHALRIPLRKALGF